MLRVVVSVTYDAEMPAGQFATVQEFISQLEKAGAKVGVVVNDTTPAATRRRARGNGGGDTQPPADVQAPSDTPPEDEADEEFGAPTASGLSPDEARDKGIALCRMAFNVAQDQVKALRKQLGVTKFQDVPATQAHEFLKLAEALAEKAGVRV